MTNSFEQQLAWARLHMPRLQRAIKQLPPLTGVRLACSMHLDLKMVPLVEALRKRGIALFITTCNPTTVRNEAVEAMRQTGAIVEAWHNMPATAYQQAIEQALDWQPTHLCEMGADLTHALHQRTTNIPNIIVGLEATGSGINRLAGLTPHCPIFNWDDLPVKEGLHNRHMVGLTTWHTFFERTRLTLHEKIVLVVGYGSVGRGVAASAKAYGGMICIAERDPIRAIEARYDGWSVKPLDEILPQADVVVTATGASQVISAEMLPQLKNSMFLLNVGHQADEIAVSALRAYPHQMVLPQVEAFKINQRTIYLLAGGAMVNLTAGEGDSLNSFDITLAVLTKGIHYILTETKLPKPGVHMLPPSVWQGVVSSVGNHDSA